MGDTNMPQMLERFDAYLRKYGLEIMTADGVRMMNPSVHHPCVLCGNATETQIYIPHLGKTKGVRFGVSFGAVCMNLARCEQRRKDREAAEKAVLESRRLHTVTRAKARLKAIEKQIVFPE